MLRVCERTPVCPLAVAIWMCTLFTDMEIEIEWINNEADEEEKETEEDAWGKNFTKLISMANQHRLLLFWNGSLEIAAKSKFLFEQFRTKKGCFRHHMYNVHILTHFPQFFGCTKGDAVFSIVFFYTIRFSENSPHKLEHTRTRKRTYEHTK